jgi:hypothetical protein
VCTMGGLGGLFKIEQAAANLERPDATRRVASRRVVSNESKSRNDSYE